MSINYKIQTFDNQQPPQILNTIKIRNASVMPMIGHVLNIDLEDFIVQEVRHRVAYKTHEMTDENGIQHKYQEVDSIDVIAVKKEDSASYSIK